MKGRGLKIIFKRVIKNSIFPSSEENNILSGSSHFFIDLALFSQSILKELIRNNRIFLG